MLWTVYVRTFVLKRHVITASYRTCERSPLSNAFYIYTTMTGLPKLQVDIWSDVACPWCWVGVLRYKKAVAKVGKSAKVVTKYHPYLIDPATKHDGETEDMLSVTLSHLQCEFSAESSRPSCHTWYICILQNHSLTFWVEDWKLVLAQWDNKGVLHTCIPVFRDDCIARGTSKCIIAYWVQVRSTWPTIKGAGAQIPGPKA